MRMEAQDNLEHDSNLYREGLDDNPDRDLLRQITHLCALVPKTEQEAEEIEANIANLREQLNSKRESAHKQGTTSLH